MGGGQASARVAAGGSLDGECAESSAFSHGDVDDVDNVDDVDDVDDVDAQEGLVNGGICDMVCVDDGGEVDNIDSDDADNEEGDASSTEHVVVVACVKNGGDDRLRTRGIMAASGGATRENAVAEVAFVIVE